MDLSHIYSKTSKGILESNIRSLTREHGRVLSMIDGKTTVAEILEKNKRLSQNRLAAVLDELVSAGFIRLAGASTNASAVDDLGFSSTIIVEQANTQAFFEAQAELEREMARQTAVTTKAAESERATLLAEVKADIAAEAAAIKREDERRKAESAEAEARRAAEAKARAEAEAAEKARQEVRRKEAEAKTRAEAEAKARAAEAARLKAEQEAKARESEALARARAEQQAREEAERKAKAEQQARREAEQKAKQAEAEAKARMQAEADAKAKAEQEAKLRAEMQAKLDALEEAQRRAEEQADAMARQLEEARVAADLEARAKRRLEARAKEEAEERARVEAESRAKLEEESRRRAEAEAKAKEEAEARRRAELAAQAQLEQERLAREEAERKAREEAEAKARAEEERRRAEREAAELAEKARQEAEQKARQAEAERKAREEAEARERAETEARQKREREDAARAEADRLAREEAEARARIEEAARQAEREARETAEREAREREAAQQRAREEAAAQARAEAEAEQRRVEEAIRREQEEEQRLREEAEARAKAAAEHAAVLAPPRPRFDRKWIKYAASGLGLLALLVLALVHVLSFNFYLPTLEAELGRSLGQRVSVQNLHFAAFPTPHWRMDGITVGDAQQIRAQHIELTPTFGAWFGDVKQVGDVEIEGAVVRLPESLDMLDAWRRVQASSVPYQFGAIKVRSSKLQIPDLELPTFNADIDQAGGKLRKAHLVSTDRRVTADLLPQADGMKVDVSAAGALPIAPRIELSRLKFTALARGNSLVTQDIDGDLYGGSLSGSGELSWGEKWSFKAELAVKQLSLEPALAAISREVRVMGLLESKARIVAMGSRLDELMESPQVQATFRAKDGEILNLDLVGALHAASRGNGITGGKTHFNEISGYLRLANGRYDYQQLKLNLGVVSATGNATVNADRSLSGNLIAELRSRATTMRVPLALTGNIGAPTLKAAGNANAIRRAMEAPDGP